MQSSGPVHSDIALSAVQTRSSLHGSTRANTAELEQAIKHWTVVTDVILALFSNKVFHIVGRDLVQELYVLVRVELRHFVFGSRLRALVEVSMLRTSLARSSRVCVHRSPFWCTVHNS